MREAVSADRVWPVKEFFEAKVAEQQDRHLKANDTAYNLEPNVKTGPGGLRDIQTIAWVAKRHFGASSLDELRTHGFLSLSELRKLKQAQSFLWKVRFGLHVAHRAGAKTGCCSITRSSSRSCSATRTPRTRSRSSSSCSATTAR